MTPSEYEIFVEKLYLAVQAAEYLAVNFKSVKLEKNVRLENVYGVKREFDIYWHYELDGDSYKTVIECKNYGTRIAIEKVDALIGKTKDFKDLTPILATRTGYQSGAVAAAKFHNIDLLIAREQDLSDWTDENGQPFIRHLRIEMNFIPPSLIHSFNPELDAAWVRNNTKIDTSKPLQLSGMNNEMVIQEEDGGTEYTLQELASRLRAPEGMANGRFRERTAFKNAYFVHPEVGRLRLTAYTVDYSSYDVIRENIEIDFGAELIGIIEYLNRGQKKLVFKDRVVTRGI